MKIQDCAGPDVRGGASLSASGPCLNKAKGKLVSSEGRTSMGRGHYFYEEPLG